MSRTAIAIDGLGKRYHLGESAPRSDTLYDTLAGALLSPLRRWRRLAGRGDAQEPFWALRELDLSVGEGEVLGVIGRNGAGKSTLLKVLSRITEPSEGRIVLRGRVASLLEVGTGFHPELTGRENVFLNGAILGMRQREIARQFDSIVEFAEIDRFLDTPVKRYSSGMYVRLAFAVAAHLDPDVLLVDEVLAVGDEAFRQRCLGKMRDVAGEGRTVLFVSHDMAAIARLCTTALWLGAGRRRAHGVVHEVVHGYLQEIRTGGHTLHEGRLSGPLRDVVRFHELRCLDEAGVQASVFSPTQTIRVRVRGESARALSRMDITLGVFCNGVRLASLHDAAAGTDLPAGSFCSEYLIRPGVLRPGSYQLAVGGRRGNGEWVWGEDIASLELAPFQGEEPLARDLGIERVRSGSTHPAGAGAAAGAPDVGAGRVRAARYRGPCGVGALPRRVVLAGVRGQRADAEAARHLRARAARGGRGDLRGVAGADRRRRRRGGLLRGGLRAARSWCAGGGLRGRSPRPGPACAELEGQRPGGGSPAAAGHLHRQRAARGSPHRARWLAGDGRGGRRGDPG
jgi:lipopolysaccharide transport system ATP-binding protein